MNLSIVPGAATEDAKQIEQIVKEIEVSMKELDRVINATIPARVETQWSLDFQKEWNKTYNKDVKDTMVGMKASAANLKHAVDKALEYNK